MRKVLINTSPLFIILSFFIVCFILIYTLCNRELNSVIFDAVIFFLGALFLLKKGSVYLNSVRANFFKEGDPVVIIQDGREREYGKFERLISSPEDWMTDDLKKMVIKQVLKTKLPMAIVIQKGGLAVTTPDRLIMVK